MVTDSEMQPYDLKPRMEIDAVAQTTWICTEQTFTSKGFQKRSQRKIPNAGSNKGMYTSVRDPMPRKQVDITSLSYRPPSFCASKWKSR